MSRETREDARRLAEQKLREAQLWWAGWELSIHKYRCWAMIYIAQEYALRQLGRLRRQPVLIAQATKLILVRNAAHDHMLIAKESIATHSQCAFTCEDMARIYYEEYEQRETYRDVHTEERYA